MQLNNAARSSAEMSRARSLLVVIVAMKKRINTCTHCASARQANAKHDRDDDGDPVPRVCCLQWLMLLRFRQSGRLQSQGGCCSTWADASTLGRCSGRWVFTPVTFSGTRESTRSIVRHLAQNAGSGETRSGGNGHHPRYVQADE
jgi:hypothetical protein